MDVQEEAVRKVRRIKDGRDWVRVEKRSHAPLLPNPNNHDVRGEEHSVLAVVYNLGYLPNDGFDKLRVESSGGGRVMTDVDSSVQSIAEGVGRLKVGYSGMLQGDFIERPLTLLVMSLRYSLLLARLGGYAWLRVTQVVILPNTSACPYS